MENPNQDVLQDEGQPSGDVQQHLDSMSTEKADFLLANTLRNIPTVSAEKIPALLVALKASGIVPQADGSIPNLSVALKSLKFHQPELFHTNGQPGVNAMSRADLQELFGKGSNAALANSFCLRDREGYRAAKEQARALGIL